MVLICGHRVELRLLKHGSFVILISSAGAAMAVVVQYDVEAWLEPMHRVEDDLERRGGRK